MRNLKNRIKFHAFAILLVVLALLFYCYLFISNITEVIYYDTEEYTVLEDQLVRAPYKINKKYISDIEYITLKDYLIDFFDVREYYSNTSFEIKNISNQAVTFEIQFSILTSEGRLKSKKKSYTFQSGETKKVFESFNLRNKLTTINGINAMKITVTQPLIFVKTSTTKCKWVKKKTTCYGVFKKCQNDEPSCLSTECSKENLGVLEGADKAFPKRGLIDVRSTGLNLRPAPIYDNFLDNKPIVYHLIPARSKVMILSKDPQLTYLNGKRHYWYKIEYIDSIGKSYKGYVWGANLKIT